MPDDPVAARTDAALHLDVRLDAYELRLNGEVLARLAGGAAALVPDAGAMRDIDIETAIERSEDWLMGMHPHRLQRHSILELPRTTVSD